MRLMDAFVKAGTPEARLKAARCEDFIVRGVLPFLGGHLALGAVLYQYDVHPETARMCALAAAGLGATLFNVTAMAGRSGGVLAAVGASSVLAALIFVLPGWPAALAIAVAGVAYAVAVTRDRIGGAGAALFFLHLPVLGAVAAHIPPALRVSLTMTSLLIAAVVLMARRRVGFAGAALTGGLTLADAHEHVVDGAADDRERGGCWDGDERRPCGARVGTLSQRRRADTAA